MWVRRLQPGKWGHRGSWASLTVAAEQSGGSSVPSGGARHGSVPLADFGAAPHVKRFKPAPVRFNHTTDVATILSQPAEVVPDDLMRMFRHSICEQIGQPNHDRSLSLLLERLRRLAPSQLGMRATSSILTGMAKYDPQYRALFDTVLPILTDSAVLHAKFRHPTCRHLANCVHAVIKLGCLDAPRVLAALAPSIEARIDEFKAVELANIAWSYAKLNDAVVRTRVLEAVASAARTRLTSHNDFNAQGLSMMVWSYATAALPMVSLFDAFAPVIIERIGELAARNLANVAWAYGKVGLVNLPLFRAIASASKSLVLQFSTQNLANTLWAFMKVNFRDIELFESFAPVVIPRLRDMNNLELTSSVWSYAMIDIYVPALFEAAEAEAVARKGRLGSQQIANLLYSFAMVDRRPENVLPLIETIPAAFEREKCDGLLSQMHQWRLMVSDESFNEHMASIPGVRELFARCALAFQPVPPLNAALVADVRRILELTPFSTMFQAPTKCERTGFTTSMAHYTSDAFKVAVEILGPAQFITKTDQLKPSIRLKHRILAKHGWTLSLVTHADWHGLETDRDKVLFLSNRLETTLRAENMLM